jgi:hypothetical protein
MTSGSEIKRGKARTLSPVLRSCDNAQLVRGGPDVLWLAYPIDLSGRDCMHVPRWALALNFVFIALLAAWAAALALGRNPLPWPDPGSRIFSAASPAMKAAVVELLARHGVKERFEANSGGVLRSINVGRNDH